MVVDFTTVVQVVQSTLATFPSVDLSHLVRVLIT
jgi:hypothetical protein